MFKIGTKCDPSACVNQARAQDVSDVLNASDVSMFTYIAAKDALLMSWKMLLKMKMSPGL
jgi:hypothetical protein